MKKVAGQMLLTTSAAISSPSEPKEPSDPSENRC